MKGFRKLSIRTIFLVLFLALVVYLIFYSSTYEGATGKVYGANPEEKYHSGLQGNPWTGGIGGLVKVAGQYGGKGQRKFDVASVKANDFSFPGT